MKKLKIKKHMTSFLMLAVMVVSIIGVIPKTIAYADDTEELPDYDFKQGNPYSDVSFNLFKWDSSLNGCTAVSFWNADSKSVCIARISTNSNINARYTEYYYVGKYGGGSQLDETNENVLSHSGEFTYNGTAYYYAYYEMTGTGPYQIKSGPVYKTEESLYKKSDQYICDYIADRLPTSCTIIGDDGVDTDKVPDGSLDKSYHSDKLGTLVGMEKRYRSMVVMGNGDSSGVVDERTHVFGWNKKTSTGFNLCSNGDFDTVQVYCYIKLYDVGKKNWITGNKQEIKSDKFDKLFYVSKGNASELEMKVKQTHVWNDILGKEVKEIGDSLKANDLLHNLDYKYDFYFQIVGCKDGTYYSGDYVHLHSDGSAAEITGGKYDVTSNTAKIDSNGKVTDNDDSETGTGVSGTGDNYEDAKNNADDIANKKDDDSKLDISNIKSFMNQVGNVPKAIGKLFTFLPDWVTAFIAFGFVLLITLMIIKAIRG